MYTCIHHTSFIGMHGMLNLSCKTLQLRARQPNRNFTCTSGTLLHRQRWKERVVTEKFKEKQRTLKIPFAPHYVVKEEPQLPKLSWLRRWLTDPGHMWSNSGGGREGERGREREEPSSLPQRVTQQSWREWGIKNTSFSTSTFHILWGS